MHPGAGGRRRAGGRPGAPGLSPRPAVLRGKGGSGLRPLRRAKPSHAEPPLRGRGRVPGEAEHRPPPRPPPNSHRVAPRRSGGAAPPPLCSREEPPPAPPVRLSRRGSAEAPVPSPPRRAGLTRGAARHGTAPPRGRGEGGPRAGPGRLPSAAAPPLTGEGGARGWAGRPFPLTNPGPGAVGRLVGRGASRGWGSAAAPGAALPARFVRCGVVRPGAWGCH